MVAARSGRNRHRNRRPCHRCGDLQSLHSPGRRPKPCGRAFTARNTSDARAASEEARYRRDDRSADHALAATDAKRLALDIARTDEFIDVERDAKYECERRAERTSIGAADTGERADHVAGDLRDAAAEALARPASNASARYEDRRRDHERANRRDPSRDAGRRRRASLHRRAQTRR